MKYLITGKNGQLAKAFIRRLQSLSLDFVAPDESQCDITDGNQVNDIVESYKPDVIINCAAYNFVDRGEQESEKAFQVNASGTRVLASASQKQSAFLVHFSSDYVFDGSKEDGLYTEDDTVNPLNVYGRSKLEGEKLITEVTDDYLIFRLSWVFGKGKQNFIAKLMEWSQTSEYVKVTCDEFSVPTHTETVAEITMKALDKGVSGLYHVTNSGYCSRYEWAKFVLSSLGIKKFVRPVPIDTFHLPAKRPVFSAMSNERISRILNVNITDWEKEVAVFLGEH